MENRELRVADETARKTSVDYSCPRVHQPVNCLTRIERNSTLSGRRKASRERPDPHRAEQHTSDFPVCAVITCKLLKAS